MALSDRDASAIAGFPLFSDIEHRSLAPILSRCKLRALGAGEILLLPGVLNDVIYFVVRGQLQVRLHSVDDEVSFPVLPGDFVGEMSVIDGLPTTALVVADQPCDVFVLPSAVLWQDLAPLPGLMRKLLQLVSMRLRQRNRAMFETEQQRRQLAEIERDLANAREVQSSMLPAQRPFLPVEFRLEVEAVMVPAKEVGGDFFDVFTLGANHACVVVGDVSGKGMPAALYMARVLAQLRAEARVNGNPESLLPRLNDALAKDNANTLFVTICLVAINIETGQAVIASGGHDAPLGRLGDTGWALLQKPRGPLIGVVPGARFEVTHIQLQPSDLLVLYTDGVTEAENAAHRLYTGLRLRQDLEQGAPSGPADALRLIRQRVREHANGHPASDDLTLLAFRFRAGGLSKETV